MSTASSSSPAEAVRDSLLVTQLASVAGSPAVVTIGTFDGVHAGHQALLSRARELADFRRERLVAITFSPRPEALTTPGRSILPDICSVDERVGRLRDAGADAIAVVTFSAAVMAMPAREFMMLLEQLVPMSTLCVGGDFKLGRRGTGTVAALRSLGFVVEAVDVIARPRAPRKISSSTIRRSIKAGIPAVLALQGLAPVLGHDLEQLTS
jgi:riboflavin kinase/FMN adenylyltransferase